MIGVMGMPAFYCIQRFGECRDSLFGERLKGQASRENLQAPNARGRKLVAR
jgi:tRNA(Glu) U13 pseudouridine synthase TruD